MTKHNFGTKKKMDNFRTKKKWIKLMKNKTKI